MDAGSGDNTGTAFSMSWVTAAEDATIYSIATTLIDDIESYAKSAYPKVPNTRYVKGNLDFK